MDKKILKYIIILFILVITGLIALIVLTKNNNGKEKYYNLELTASKEITEDKLFSDYITFNSLINKYFNLIKEQNVEGLLGILSEEFIDNEEITNENIFKKLNLVNSKQVYYSTKIYELESSLNVRNYFVYGNIVNSETNKSGAKLKCNFIIKNDLVNNTFSIAPYGSIYNDYIEYFDNKVEQKNNIDYDKMSKSIDTNENNRVSRIDANDEQIAEFYLKYYIQDAKYYKEDAYNLLDEEFKNKRFDSFKKYEEYINETVDKLPIAILNKYKATQMDGYKEYLCIDNYGKYYIFKETAPMQFTVLLDVYTIERPEITEKYNKADDIQKVGICINTFFAMIDNADYESAYNKLDSDFKNNYFKNVGSFKEYVKNNFYNNNKVLLSNTKKTSSVYTIDVDYYDANTYVISNNYIPEGKKKTFIVKLLDDNNFVMSFNVNE